VRARLVLFAAACGLLALAVALAPTPRAREGGGALGALGASMGGFRVAFVDLLFLRAERLLREGRVEEVPPLYEAIRELDPENAAAADHLAAVYAYDLLGEAPDTVGRLYWWVRAWDLVQEALEIHPEDASLLMRSSDLLLEIAPRDPDLEALVALRVPDPRRRGFERLLASARVAATLPRRGRIHLLRLAVLLPVEAALRLEAGEDVEPILALGEEALGLRRPTLAEMRLPDPEGAVGPGEALDVMLEAGMEVVRTVGRALAAGDEAGAREALGRYQARVPGTEVGTVLARVLAAHGG
jgi:hypothetical protein